MKDDSPFVFAGLWEGWKDPVSGEWLRTYTIITGEPNEFVREIHTRLPVILPEEHRDTGDPSSRAFMRQGFAIVGLRQIRAELACCNS
jgi:hypothetical protein